MEGQRVFCELGDNASPPDSKPTDTAPNDPQRLKAQTDQQLKKGMRGQSVPLCPSQGAEESNHTAERPSAPNIPTAPHQLPLAP